MRRRPPGRDAGRGRRATGSLDLFGAIEPASDGSPGEPTDVIPLIPRRETIGSSASSAISVAALTESARDVLEGAFAPLWVRGEVSDFKAHRNGHWYFCLRDANAQIRCVVWSRDQRHIPAPPDDGMQVAARGQLSVYPARGDMQLVVNAMEGMGDGLWRKALERALARLRDDGLLAPERKRALPRLPRRVAVVTSPDGAALHDIVAVIRRRCPVVEIVVVPAKVQGDGATMELAAAIERVSRWSGAETVIVGRGGGAREDLWAFNDEQVARVLAACSVPTISAVGHEVDVTLCDLVADHRAPTPSAAAEAAVPVLAELRAVTVSVAQTMRGAIERRLAEARSSTANAARGLRVGAERAMERRAARMTALAGRLDALSPLATLARGYAVARDANGRALTRRADFPPGLDFKLTLHDGTVPARATETPTGVEKSSTR